MERGGQRRMTSEPFHSLYWTSIRLGLKDLSSALKVIFNRMLYIWSFIPVVWEYKDKLEKFLIFWKLCLLNQNGRIVSAIVKSYSIQYSLGAKIEELWGWDFASDQCLSDAY